MRSFLMIGLVFSGIGAAVGEDGGACASHAAAISLRVENIKEEKGKIRAQIYSDNAEEFLEKGKKLVRVEAPVTADAVDMCVPLPKPGHYALVVMHDINGNGRADFFSEGFGFSNNPKLGLGKPDHEEVRFKAGGGLTSQTVYLKYFFGGAEEKEKRRAARRR